MKPDDAAINRALAQWMGWRVMRNTSFRAAGIEWELVSPKGDVWDNTGMGAEDAWADVPNYLTDAVAAYALEAKWLTDHPYKILPSPWWHILCQTWRVESSPEDIGTLQRARVLAIHAAILAEEGEAK